LVALVFKHKIVGYDEAFDEERLVAELERALERGASPGKRALLAELVAQDRKKSERQIQFVSAIIKSQLRNHPDPDRLAATIVSECIKASYDPIFVTAVIRSESMFRHRAVSHRGARGLMQIMPTTGRYIVERNNMTWSGEDSLNDPRTNVRLGISYLKYLEKKFAGNREKVLIAYNWGPGNLMSASNRRLRVPEQSMKYARTILSNHRRWSTVYQRFASYAEGFGKLSLG
jgi:soluble lytic murein transglycosylase-like protein